MRTRIYRLCFAFALGLAAILLALLGLARITPARAAGTIYVDDDCISSPGAGTVGDPYCTIQFGVANAGIGDTIVISPGTYSGTVYLGGKVLTLAGSGAGVTIVDGSASSNNPVFDIYSGSVVTISGVTIQNASLGRGIRSGGSSNLLLMDAIVYNNNSGDTGGGIRNSGGTMVVKNTQIISNSGGGTGGGGIANQNAGATLELIDTIVASNTTTGGGGGIYTNRPLTLTNTVVVSNIAAFDGGGLYNFRAYLALFGTTIADNVSINGDGGGIHNSEGIVHAVDNHVLNNRAAGSSSDGGGVRNLDGVLALREMTIDGNEAHDGGGGIYATGTSTTTLDGCTVSNNTAGLWGGGVSAWSTAVLTNVTLSGNRTDSFGGGVYANYTTTLVNCTVVSNTADFDGNDTGDGGGMAVGTGKLLFFSNTIVAGNVDASPGGNDYPDCSGATSLLTSGDYNLVGIDAGCGFTPQANDQVGTAGSPLDPQVGPLADNGGRTETHALLVGSPALDTIPNGTNGCGGPVATGQRGTPRPQSTRCDTGSFEKGTTRFLVTKTADDDKPDAGQRITYTIVVQNTGWERAHDGYISDTLPADLTFIGPVQLEGSSGTVASSSGDLPALATGLTLEAQALVTVTFPVSVSAGLDLGTEITNTAAVTSAEVTTPATGSEVVEIKVFVFLPLVMRDY